MLDAQYIRENLEAVKTNCRNRNVKADVDQVVALDDQRRQLVQEMQVLQERANAVSKLTPKEKDAAKRQELVAEGRSLKEKIAGFDPQLKKIKEDLDALLKQIPNMTHPQAP